MPKEKIWRAQRFGGSPSSVPAKPKRHRGILGGKKKGRGSQTGKGIPGKSQIWSDSEGPQNREGCWRGQKRSHVSGEGDWGTLKPERGTPHGTGAAVAVSPHPRFHPIPQILPLETPQIPLGAISPLIQRQVQNGEGWSESVSWMHMESFV